MSDDEEDYEYEYDDDAMEEEQNQFEYTDEEEEQNDVEVEIENAYYNAKGLRETNLAEAVEAFENVIQQEQNELNKEGTSASSSTTSPKKKPYGQWSYKAMKQLVKLHLRSANYPEMMKHYHRLLECIATGDVSPNAVEKGIQGMLERVASLYQGQTPSFRSGNNNNMMSISSDAETSDPQFLALSVYDATLTVFHPETGACKNERLWFKTNLKYGQLLYEINETSKLQQVLKDLKVYHVQTGPVGGSSVDDDYSMSSGGGGGSSTQSMEIYALQIQLYSRQKDNKKLRETFNKAMNVRGGIPHPRTLALIQELGGKMHMSAREYEAAGKTFFQAFKSYDEAGDPSRLRCLKYLVLASMLHASTINPFDSQEARPYRDDPEIVAMTALVQAFHNNDIQQFEKILRKNQGGMMEDEFVREHVEDLLRTIHMQVLRRVIRPYNRISLQAIARELNDIPVSQVESLLVSLILDGGLDAKIDAVTGVLLKKPERGLPDSSAAAGTTMTLSSTSSSLSTTPVTASVPVKKSEAVKQCEAMEEMMNLLDNLHTQINSVRIKEGTAMRSIVH